jgi:enoyl-CoA hydratase/carnithine racemase
VSPRYDASRRRAPGWCPGPADGLLRARATTGGRTAHETLIVAREGGVVTIKLNRPKQLNAINRTVVRELSEVVDGLASDPEARVVIFTGAGERAFVAGADISEFQGLSTVDALTFGQRIQGLYNRIEALPQVTLAAANGFALGGGASSARPATSASRRRRRASASPRSTWG